MTAFPSLALLAVAVVAQLPAESPQRWKLDQGRLTWSPSQNPRLPHTDRVEMSGKRAAAWVSYGADAQGRLELSHACVFPTLRVAPNDTHSSLMVRFQSGKGLTWMNRKGEPLLSSPDAPCVPKIRVDGAPAPAESLRQAAFEEGLLRLTTSLGGELRLVREILPSAEGTAILERWLLRNEGKTARNVAVEALATEARLPFDYVDKGLARSNQPVPAPQRRTGTYGLAVTTEGLTPRALTPGAQVELLVTYGAWDLAQPRPAFHIEAEVTTRRRLFAACRDNLRFECPDPVLSTLFDFSKFRASESIIATAHGPMHAPGGCSYYAALWANDSVEYVAPFYPWLGYGYGLEANRNTFEHFARYLNAEGRPLPSSIVAEGTDIWAGAGDRGDQAMLAYGVATTLLATGDAVEARRHWPLITWCLDYLEKKVTADGVIASDADELEGRFSHGKTSLNTSVLTFGALKAAANLAAELGEPERAASYRTRAQALETAIERFFGADVRGFQTYRYHEGLEELRAWICMPLTMGILTRKEGTLAALFSPRLWTADGLLTAEGSTTFWDRSSLYALRGVFQAGEPDLALKHLQALSRRRLLGEHVPYVVEAYPEGNGRHLSAESALYARIITEGIFGLEPTGFRRFTIRPSLPSTWNHMALRDIRAFASRFDLEVRRQGASRLLVTVRSGGRTLRRIRLRTGEAGVVTLP